MSLLVYPVQPEPGQIVVGGPAGPTKVSRAVVNPLPGAARLNPLPTVMTTPPTVTIGVANAATQITNSALVPWTDSRFRALGGTFTLAGAAYPDNQCGRFMTITTPNPPYPWRVEFEYDGTAFEFLTKCVNTANQYRLWIDGQPATATPQAGPQTAGSLFLVLVQFSARANRRIIIEGNFSYFGGVRIGPTETIWPCSTPAGPRVIALGDSFTEGTGAAWWWNGYPARLGQLLGWRDVWPSGLGGTGYLNPSTGGKVKYRDRVQADVIAYAPDVVLVQGSINDVGYGGLPASTFGAEAGLLYSAIQTALPHVLLCVLLPFPMNSANNAANTPNRDAIKNAAQAARAVVIDPIAEAWLSGTGNVGATTGTGNADWYEYSDAKHPSDDGHAYLGRRIAAALTAQASV